MFNLALRLDKGQGVVAPDYAGAADWYRRAADGGSQDAAINLGLMYAVGRGRAQQMMDATLPNTSLSLVS
jgi:TPR repeat protein